MYQLLFCVISSEERNTVEKVCVLCVCVCVRVCVGQGSEQGGC